MPAPYPFAQDTYIKWHDECCPEDKPLGESLESFRDDLRVKARSDLECCAKVLAYVADYCRNEYTETEYNLPFVDTLKKTDHPSYDLLFKSVPSIINKLWRKNQGKIPEVTLGNLTEEIGDLIRTSIVATTLDSAAFLAARMNKLPDIIYQSTTKKTYENAIESILFAPEMKMASGYFAFHGEIRFKSGLRLEVQIYSELMSQWRKLSHRLYEIARTEQLEQFDYNSREARLISLGHMLHLAECQLQQLAQDFAQK